MKKIKFQILILMFLLAGTLSAQEAVPKVVKKMRGDKATIIVEAPADSGITRFKLVNEETDEPVSEIVTEDNTVLFEVELSEGENNFNLFGYKNKEVVFISKAPIKFTRKEDQSTSAETKPTVKPPKTKKVEEPVKQDTDEDEDEANKVGVFLIGTEGSTATLSIKADGKLYAGCEEKKSDDTVKKKKEAFEKCQYKIKIVGKNKEKREFREDIKIRDYDTDPEKKAEPVLPQRVAVKLYEGNNTITVSVVSEETKEEKVGDKTVKKVGEKEELVAQTKIKCTDCEDDAPKSVNYRAIVGFQQVGASSADSQQSPYLNLRFETPIKRFDKRGGRMLSAWGDLNFQPQAIQSLANLSNFATTVIGNDKPNNFVQGFDFLVGLEFDLLKKASFPGVFGTTNTSLSFIVSGGATLPLTTDSPTAYYKIPKDGTGDDAPIKPAFAALFPSITPDKDVIAFVAPKRDRFFRQYYAGLRLKTYFDNKNMFPANFDVMLGQNEAVTNTLKGVILRLDGSTPFPIKGADFLYVFGGVQMKLSRKFNDRIPSFFLEQSQDISLSNDSVFVAPIDKNPLLLSNRDTFRLGVGIDLFKVFKRNNEAPSDNDPKE